MLDSLKLRGRILACIIIPLLVSSVLATLIVSNVRKVDKLDQQIGFSSEVIDYLAEATLHAIRMERSTRGYLVNAKDRHRQGFETGSESYSRLIKSLEPKIAQLEDPIQRQRFEEYTQLGNQLRQINLQTLQLAQTGQMEEAVALFSTDQSSNITREIESIYNAFVQQERETLALRKVRAKEALDLSLAIAGWGTAMIGLVTIAIGAKLVSSIRDRIERAIHEVATSSTEFAATFSHQETSTNAQATSVNQTTASMEELNASSRATAEQAESAAANAILVLNLVDSSNHHELPVHPSYRLGSNPSGIPSRNRQMGHQNTSLKETVNQIAKRIEQLTQQLSQIDEIASNVSNIANQTNMLALNASVEAVRAGEAGKGFGVVATEIRKLADHSGRCADRINSLVKEIQSATSLTVQVTAEGTKTVEVVVEAIDEIVNNTQQISLTAQQQAIAIQQVFEAMNALNRIASETVNSISQAKLGTDKLNQAALDLKEMV
ncbi:methyl-accepting chemotaxis protein [Oscillatoria acuminata]|uniref:Methyl-accepting chemotaxis protein n=1 Tax=Oscillatoria acuminata PCC 6304 TaxID=56110 RepID=K9THG3_9CYAN|nr:methyl-accepting chemotaxis protein [Oscillatoria acuminata]AFY81990.1 methyl-accepting chemotaxis protein [Oscillatoria acuminata PCC 6304]